MPAVPPKLVAIAATVSAVLGFAATYAPSLPFLPDWVPTLCWLLSAVAALFAGLGLPAFQGGGSLVPSKLAPLLGTVSMVLTTAAAAAPEGFWRNLLGFVAVSAVALTGKAIPVKTPEPELSLPPRVG
jgi:hypothetical protein